MDMIETDLASSFGQKGNSSKKENSIKSEVNSDLETVSYRVLEFGEEGMEQLTESNTITATTVPSLINGAPVDGSAAKLALIAPKDTTNDPRGAVLMSGGQLYVISEVSAGQQRSVVSRTAEPVNTPRHSMSSREEKRRVTHNEVERRRRDKINNWIGRLAKILPDCPEMHHRNSQALSKGGILAKACDTITELRQKNEQLVEMVKKNSQEGQGLESFKSTNSSKQNTQKIIQELESLKKANTKLLTENSILLEENNTLKNESAILRSRLQQFGQLNMKSELL